METLSVSEQTSACPLCTAAISVSAGVCPACGMPQTAYRELLGLPSRHFARGTRLMQRGSYDEALEHFYAARRLQPDKTEGLKRTVSSLMNLGRYEYALQTLMAEESPDAENLAMRASCVQAIDNAHSLARDARTAAIHPSDGSTQTLPVSRNASVGVSAPAAAVASSATSLTSSPTATSPSQKRKRDTRSRRKAKQKSR